MSQGQGPQGLSGAMNQLPGPLPQPNPQRNAQNLQEISPEMALPPQDTSQAREALSELLLRKMIREIEGGPIGSGRLAMGTPQTNTTMGSSPITIGSML